MAGDQLGANFESLDQNAKNIINTARFTEGRLEELAKKIRELEETWVGSASEEFQITKNQWFKSANALRETMHNMGHTVSQSNADYIDNEAKIGKLFKQG